MGEAKKRGSYVERMTSAKSKLDSLRPKKITCSECSSDITEIRDGSTRHLKGIEAYFLGFCPNCSKLNYQIHGEPRVSKALEEALIKWELSLGQDDDPYGEVV